MILEMEEQIRTRHLSPTEKLSRHPVGWPGCLKRIGEGSMTEYMYEQACLIPTPTRKTAQEHLVVSDMLEHLPVRQRPYVQDRRIASWSMITKVKLSIAVPLGPDPSVRHFHEES